MTPNQCQQLFRCGLFTKGEHNFGNILQNDFREVCKNLLSKQWGEKAKLHATQLQQLINSGIYIEPITMNDLNQWLQQMGQVGGPQGEQGKQGEAELDMPEMEGGVDIGQQPPQGLREVRYNRPGTAQSIFNPQNQPEQSEGQQKKKGQQGQPQTQTSNQNNQQMPATQEPSAIEKMLETAMKMAEQEREDRKRQHEEQMQKQQAQDSETVQQHEERLSNLEQRVEDIEGNYVGTATFEDGLGALQKQLSEVSQPKLVQIPERPEVRFDKRTHCEFDEVLFLAQLFQQVYIVGPAGTGKTSLAGDIAAAMSLPFGFISCTAGMAEAHLLGRMLADGKYLPTSFVDCFENGGLFLFDEVDAADANTMLVINSALANGILSVPNRAANPKAVRHPNFVCIVAANTLGTGSFEYHGRNYLDAAFLDRFALSRHRVDYDIALEREMLAGDAEMCRVLHKMRHNLETTKTRRVLSTRAFIGTAKLLLAGKDPQYVIDKLLLGWTDEEKARALQDVVVPKRSPLKDIGEKQREADKTKREQAAAAQRKSEKAAQKALAEVAEATVVVEETTYAEEVPA